MIGQQFGNYRAISLLGEGGMGAVYLAEHPAIGRRVAVKVLHKNYIRDENLLTRFLNEARAANAIRHPNIIEILDSGTIADGTPFLVMELLEGESLGTRIRRDGALPIADRASSSATRPPRRWGRRTRRGSSTAISSPTTCSSCRIRTIPSASGSRCSTSGSPSCSRERQRLGQDAHRHADGDADLHVARAVPRDEDRRPPQRHLLAGDHLLRDAVRAAAVRLGGVRRAGQHAPQRRPAGAVDPERQRLADARRHRSEDAVEEPGRALRRHGRAAGRRSRPRAGRCSWCAARSRRRPTSGGKTRGSSSKAARARPAIRSCATRRSRPASASGSTARRASARRRGRGRPRWSSSSPRRPRSGGCLHLPRRREGRHSARAGGHPGGAGAQGCPAAAGRAGAPVSPVLPVAPAKPRRPRPSRCTSNRTRPAPTWSTRRAGESWGSRRWS